MSTPSPEWTVNMRETMRNLQRQTVTFKDCLSNVDHRVTIKTMQGTAWTLGVLPG